MFYRLSKEAEQDLQRIYEFGVLRFGQKQADLYLEEILDCFDTIVDHPYSFVKVEFLGPKIRRCVCGSGSIYYRVEENHIDILAIIGKQEPRNM